MLFYAVRLGILYRDCLEIGIESSKAGLMSKCTNFSCRRELSVGQLISPDFELILRHLLAQTYIQNCVDGIGSKTYEWIPWTSAETDSVIADSQAAHTVIMTDEWSDLFAARNVPDLWNLWVNILIILHCLTLFFSSSSFTYSAFKVVITSKQ